MPSKNMLPKGHRHRSVRSEYVRTRGVEEPTAPVIPTLDLTLTGAPGPEKQASLHTITAPAEARGLRVDQYLAQAIPEISRSRVQLLLENGQITVNGVLAKPKHKVTPGETIVILGAPHPAPLHATPEDIPLDILFEDQYLAVVNKPAGMQVHAGAGAASTDDDEPDPRSSGTLVNALLHHFSGQLSAVGGELRPGIVHRLDKQTSGLLLVAKDDLTHRQLGDLFAAREVDKTYLAVVHGHIPRRGGASPDLTTVSLPIGRDLVRRTRMTTRRPADAPGVRSAVSHIRVLDRLSTPYGPFSSVEVTIETGRTHQIRVHLQSLGTPVVGDTLYGARREIQATLSDPGYPTLALPRNFLHATRLAFTHPRTRKALSFEAPLPPDLTSFLESLQTVAPKQ